MIDLSRLRLALLRRRAAGMVEYGALAALIAVAALGAVMMLGQRTGDLTERTNDILVGDAPPPGAPAGAPLQGILPGVLVWGPPFLEFALSPVQPTVQATATLSNTGGGRSLPFSPLQISGPDAMAFSIVATDCPATLGAGESCTVTVAATAASNGVLTATLGAAGAPGGVSLTAVATGFEPLLAWSTPAAVAVDGTPGPDPLPRTHVQTLTLTNDSFANAPGVAPAVLAASGATVALTHDCPAVLPPLATCTVTVTVTATDNGPISATLTSGGSSPTQPVEVVLAGAAAGFAPAFAWSGGGAFTLTAPDSNPATVDQTFTLTNVGTLAGTPAVPTVSGSGPGYAFSPVSHDCTGVLAVGETCSATVRATYTDNVAAATGTLGGPATFDLTGSASGFAPAWAFDAAPDGVFSITAPATSTSKTFTLRNTGTLAGAVPARSISGPHALDYTITGGTCASQTLAPNATCTVVVTFTANDNVSNRTATLAAGGASKALTGSASGFAPAFAWSGGGAFTLTSPTGNPAVVDRTFILTNTGTLAGTPAVPTVSGSGPGYSFSLVSHNCTGVLAVGATCSATVRAIYTNNVAAATGTLGGPATLALTGSASGFAPAWAFDAEPDGEFRIFSPPPWQMSKTFTLRNTGTLAGTVPPRSISGPYATYYFSITGGTCASQTLEPNATCSVVVRFSSPLNNHGAIGTLTAGGASKNLSGLVSYWTQWD
jgi:hypothetical protein